ncbi:putative beta-lysine N-acetyltransferase [Bacillus sp. AGMB 02131]|uniref:Beta-lysine N-acetyltransferase n=1 Tax=Peribacillus faecalis TaxID=2772559 RepID=A0A927CZF3_9BACI|nr:putative beta-lysine N-acetyltransferase [Peribacillus faecalis]MBD3109841.1 putative beta-lysine N-acetyltransferase [Peribacillus faecalis]
MSILPKTYAEHTENYKWNITKDSYNKRVRVDDFYGDAREVIKAAIQKTEEWQCEKLIIKARNEDLSAFIEKGFNLEAMVDKYFSGNTMYFMCMYLTAERRKSDTWAEDDRTLARILEKTAEKKEPKPPIPSHLQLKKCGSEDSGRLAQLYDAVFTVYPVPMNDEGYVRKSIESGNVFFAYFDGEKAISAVCGEINKHYSNAEITDCATLPEYRQYGLIQSLLGELENELASQHIFCLYSIARSRSFGMNAAFYRLQYKYRGRLANNCIISEGLEDMNVWVKLLKSQKSGD